MQITFLMNTYNKLQKGQLSKITEENSFYLLWQRLYSNENSKSISSMIKGQKNVNSSVATKELWIIRESASKYSKKEGLSQKTNLSSSGTSGKTASVLRKGECFGLVWESASAYSTGLSKELLKITIMNSSS